MLREASHVPTKGLQRILVLCSRPPIAAMTTDPLIDSHISSHTASVAIKALLAHTLKKRAEIEEKALIPPKEDHVWLVLATKTMPKSTKVKPIKMYVLSMILISYR